MEAKELRIGNFIQLFRYPNIREMSVHCIKSIYFYNKVSGYYYAKLDDSFEVNIDAGVIPIPLTEEWLKKMSFEFDEEDGWEKPKIKIPSELGYAKIEKRENGIFLIDGDQSVVGKEIKYVHQLQNLFFALTGEELKISE